MATLINTCIVLRLKMNLLKIFNMQALLKLLFSKYNKGSCKGASLCVTNEVHPPLTKSNV